MSELTIDLENASPKVLSAVGKMMLELGGNYPNAQLEEPVSEAPTPVEEPVSEAPTPVEEPASALTTDATVELDKDGIPWDERIHSGNQKKTAKGIWQKRKGLADGVYETVKAELQAAATVGTQPVEEVNPFEKKPVIPDNSAAPGPGVFEQQPADTTVEINWPTVLQRISKGQVDNPTVVNKDTLDDWLQTKGVQGGVPMLANRTDLFNELLTHFGI